MYVSHKHKAIFIGVPKTASTTVNMALRRRHGFRQRGSRHSIQHRRLRYLQRRHGYMVIAGVRSPYSRAVSVWNALTCFRHKNSKKNTWERLALRQWLGERPFWEFAYLLSMFPCMDEKIPRPQSWILQGVRVDRVLYYERLLECYRALPFTGDGEALPRKMRGAKKRRSYDKSKWWHYYEDEATWEAIERWGALDFERFGYAMNREQNAKEPFDAQRVDAGADEARPAPRTGTHHGRADRRDDRGVPRSALAGDRPAAD